MVWRQLFASLLCISFLGASPLEEAIAPFAKPFLWERLGNVQKLGCHQDYCADILLTESKKIRKTCFQVPLQDQTVRTCFSRVVMEEEQRFWIYHAKDQSLIQLVVEFPFGNSRIFKGSAMEWLLDYQKSLPQEVHAEIQADGLWWCFEDSEAFLAATEKSSFIKVQIRLKNAGCEKRSLTKNRGLPISLPHPDWSDQK